MKQQIELPGRRYARMAKVILKNPTITQPRRKKGFGSSGLYTRGKLFAFLSNNDRLILKLPRRRVNELISLRKGTRWNPRRDGRGFKEWIKLRSGEEWLLLAREAMEFVASTKSQKQRGRKNGI